MIIDDRFMQLFWARLDVSCWTVAYFFIKQHKTRTASSTGSTIVERKQSMAVGIGEVQQWWLIMFVFLFVAMCRYVCTRMRYMHEKINAFGFCILILGFVDMSSQCAHRQCQLSLLLRADG